VRGLTPSMSIFFFSPAPSWRTVAPVTRTDDPELREKLEHHVRQCAECSEELEIVKKSLEP
jgi:hypothetical protein